MLDSIRSPETQKARFVPGRITVVTAVFNAASTLARCMESVLSQDYPDVEYILMDGGSTDGSVAMIQSYGDRIVWRSEKDKGIYDAWNKALDLATGEWVGFLGADDIYLPGALTKYMQLVRADVDFMSSLVRRVTASGKVEIKGAAWDWAEFQVFMTTAHVGSLHRQSLFEKYGRYNIAYKIAGDYELLLRARGELRSVFLPEITAEMFVGGVSNSFAVLDETERAKVRSGGRNAIKARIELWVAKAKFSVRSRLDRIPGKG